MPLRWVAVSGSLRLGFPDGGDRPDPWVDRPWGAVRTPWGAGGPVVAEYERGGLAPPLFGDDHPDGRRAWEARVRLRLDAGTSADQAREAVDRYHDALDEAERG